MRTFFTVEGGDSEFVNFILLTLKAFLEACSQNVSGYRMPHFFPRNCDLVSQNITERHFLFTLHHFSPVIFATATVMAFVLLCNSRFNFRCHTHCEATPTEKLARSDWDLSWLLAWKITKGIHSCKPASLNCPIVRAKIHSWWCGGKKKKKKVDHNACVQVFSSATIVVPNPRAKPKLAQPCSSRNWLGT